MAFIFCPNCGKRIPDTALKCPHCGEPVVLPEGWTEFKESSSVMPQNKLAQQSGAMSAAHNNSVNICAQSSNPVEQHATEIKVEHQVEKKRKKSRKMLWVGLAALALILLGGGIGSYFYYNNVYLPEKIDREALRTYPMVDVTLRSSKMTGGDFNKVTSIPYGAELITYNDDGEWAEVKYVTPNPNDKPLKGYVASAYLLSKSDFYLLNSIFGDDDTREVLASSKVRRGVLNYFKEHKFAGPMSHDLEANLDFSPVEHWQARFHHGQTKPNEVLFKRVYNPNSKFTDMALIIENIESGAREFLYFTYDDDETPHLRGSFDIPAGDIFINDYRMEGYSLVITFSDGTVYSLLNLL